MIYLIILVTLIVSSLNEVLKLHVLTHGMYCKSLVKCLDQWARKCVVTCNSHVSPLGLYFFQQKVVRNILVEDSTGSWLKAQRDGEWPAQMPQHYVPLTSNNQHEQ